MMKILLFDPTCLTYRIHVYEYLIKGFKKKGYALSIYYDENLRDLNNPGFYGIRYDYKTFLKIHKEERPDISIFFVWLRYKFSLPFLIYCKLFLPVRTIVWSKGINISKNNQFIMNQLYYLRQKMADALILYSQNELKYIKTNKNKVFIANNTINQYKYTLHSKVDELKSKYNISHANNVLFVGRIQKRKKLQLLLEVFSKRVENHGLIIVGDGITQEMRNIINNNDNIYYLGPIYNLDTLSEVYSISDVFCIPGEIGLGLNEAFLFGLPVITTYIRETSEMYLLFKNNINGLLYKKDNVDDLADKLLYLLDNKNVRDEFSQNARKSFEENAKIEYMYDGFINAIKYLKNNDKRN